MLAVWGTSGRRLEFFRQSNILTTLAVDYLQILSEHHKNVSNIGIAHDTKQ